MLRALSTHVSAEDGLTVTYFIYTSRLLFELIADPAISGMMKSLEPVAQVTPPAVIEKQPVQFVSTRPGLRRTPAASPPSSVASGTSSGTAAACGRAGANGSSSRSSGRRGGSSAGGRGNGQGEEDRSKRGGRGGGGGGGGGGSSTGLAAVAVAAMAAAGGGSGDDSGVAATAAARREYDFSLAGILKSAESSGYRVVDPQPADLTVDLFPYQQSSCQWMLDHERDPRGLNGYFWERREWADGGAPLWYFPLAGEFRLAEPPHITGGLLCEEMGLGKTIEVLSTILANPRDGGSHSSLKHRKSLREQPDRHFDSARRLVSRATLIVVPVSLVGQWAEGHVELTADQVRRIENRRLFDSDSSDDANLAARAASTASTALGGGTGSGNGSGNGTAAAGAGRGAEDETVRVDFKVDAALVADNDVVLTTYELLRTRKSLFQKINFHRCVLDECQEIKTATTNIAQMCQQASDCFALAAFENVFQVKASHRWMVSGTPIAGKIDSLHGELNFLQVWPFSLQNDGFWEKKVGEPFEAKDYEALELLRALIRVVMMRHSKSQTYVDGRPLVKIPARTVEWRGVEFSSAVESGQYSNASAPHARYVYKYLENLCATVCRKMEENIARESSAGGSAGGAEANGMGRREFTKLKSLLALMQKASTHPGLVNLGQLDMLKRSIQVVAPVQPLWQWLPAGGMAGPAPMASQLQASAANVQAELKARADAIETLPAEEVLRRLAQKGAGNMGGLNRDVNRHWAVGGEAEIKLRDSLQAMPLSQLKHRQGLRCLPVPRSWAVLKPKADIVTGSVDLRFGVAPPPALLPAVPSPPSESVAEGDGGAESGGGSSNSSSGKTKGKGKRKRDEGQADFDVRKLLKVSDTIRVGVNSEDNEATIEDIGERSATLACEWSEGAVKAGSVYRFSTSTRRKPYVDLLVASDKAKKGTEVQVAGFSAIYKAMAGEPVSCPICMCSVVRPTVTKCAHLFCRECISRELQRTPALGMIQLPQAKCPICRRTMKGSEMMELQTLSEVEEAMAIDASSAADNSSGEAGAGVAEGGPAAASEGGGSSSGSSGSGSGSGKGKKKARREGSEDDKEEEAEEPTCGHEHSHETNTAAGAGASANNGASASAAAPSDRAAATCGCGGSGGGNGGAGSGGGARSNGGSVAASSNERGGVGPTSTSSRGPSGVFTGDPRSAAAGASAAGDGSAAGSGGMVAGAAPAAAEEDGVAGPSLVIPTFRFTPTATATFLSQYRAATSSQSSVKLDALVRDLDTTLLHDPTAKFVIFSQYPQVVDRAGIVLSARGIRSTSIVGGRTRVERSSAVSSFTNDPSIKVILLTTGSAAAGLTLTAASTVYMLDPVWSAADEAQALNRAHRIGQTHTVRCVVFYMKDSVEERLLALRHSKGNFAQFLESADSVVSLAAPEGSGSGSSSPLSSSFVNMFALPELKKLFGMVGSQPAGAAGGAAASSSSSSTPAQRGGGSGRGGGWSSNAAGVGSGSSGVGAGVGARVPLGYLSSSDSDDDDSDGDSDRSLAVGGGGGGGGSRANQEQRDLARAIAMSRAVFEAGHLGRASGGGGGGAGAGDGSGGAAGSPLDLTRP
ncbi:unnamed protein product [Ectocarpus sp. 6 AP-2014]